MRKTLAVLAGLLAGLVIACGSTSPPKVDIPTAGPSGSTAQPTAAAAARYATPAAADFKLDVKELKRQCFGSAGCNVTFTIDVTKVGGGTYDPRHEYRLIYEITGSEDPYTNNLKIMGDQYTRDDEEMVQVKSKSQKLAAVAQSIS